MSLFPLVLWLSACGGSSDEGSNESMQRDDEEDEMTMGTQFAPGTADPCTPLPETGYLNDELCLAEPAKDVGVQLHFGPEPDEYDDPEALEGFVLQPEEEAIMCQYRTSPNETVRYWTRQHTRVRSGTHHMILYGAVAASAEPPPGGTLREGSCGPGDGYSYVAGAQSALGPEGGSLDVGFRAPEDQGMAHVLEPNTSFGIEMHYINLTDKPILTEGWTNLVFADEEDVETVVAPIYFIGGLGMNVAPKSSQVVAAGPCQSEEEVRILGFAGHAHANTTRFTAFIERAGGERELIYESYDWEEPLVARFDSVTEHLEPGDGTRDGAHSGLLTLSPGDRMTWECQVENELDQPLRFGNEALTGEMCNVFGFYAPGDKGPWECFSL